MWNFCGHIFARKIKLKLRSNSIASSDFGDYEIPAREYTEYNKSGILHDLPQVVIRPQPQSQILKFQSPQQSPYGRVPSQVGPYRIPNLSMIEPAK